MLLVTAGRKIRRGLRNETVETETIDAVGMKTVLYIDDDPTVVTVARMALQMRGFNVLTARDGLEGFEVFRDAGNDIDAIVMDECMPRMRGVGCLKAIRELDPDIGALLVSGNITESVRLEANNAGISGFLDKPYQIDDLIKEIHRVLAAA